MILLLSLTFRKLLPKSCHPYSRSSQCFLVSTCSHQGLYQQLPHENLLLYSCILTVTVKTAATGNLATTAKMRLRTMRICLNEYMQRNLSSLCSCSELVLKCLCCAWANTPCWKGKLRFCKLDLRTCKHVFQVSRLIHPCTNCAGAVCLPIQMCPWVLNLEFHHTGKLRWWLLCMGNPLFSSQADFSITLRILRISKLFPYFSPFFSVYQAFARKLFGFFRFIRAVTVQSVIIISICFHFRHARICYWQFNVPTGQQYANN